MTKQDDGGPAYPCVEETGETTEHVYSDSRCVTTEPVYRRHSGMTLRDWFAGQTLAGLSARPDDRTFVNTATGETVDEWRARLRKEDATYCYAMADAMLAARKEARWTD